MSERARILVVDDEIGPRESLRMILKPNYEIATADSGETALRTLPAFNPDLVFMDIKMPKMDGIELLQRIKAVDPTIEAVMITAYASLDTVKNALTHGAFEYLIKPFSRTDLEETVRRALARRQTELGKSNQLSTLVNEMRALSDPAHPRDEDHFGHKVEWENGVKLSRLGGGSTMCDVLMKLHQGTHSKDAFTNNLHEMVYHIRCNDGSEAHLTFMAAIGTPGELHDAGAERTIDRPDELPGAAAVLLDD